MLFKKRFLATEQRPEASRNEEAIIANERQQKLMTAMDSINKRYGSGSIQIGAENAAAWKPNQANLSPRYTTKWSDIIEIRVHC